MVLAGIGGDDTPEIADRMADKLVGLRYFEDADGRTNLAIADVGGSLLVVSQFTLLPTCAAAGARVSPLPAPPEVAVPLVDRFVERLRVGRPSVETGRFGAEMEVELVNDGPVHARPRFGSRPGT